MPSASDHDRTTPSTRDLLAEIETREHSVPRSVELERHERGFVRWLLVAVVAIITGLYGLLWWLDPISVTGRQTRFSIVENGGVRQAKLDLMEELPSAPDVFILGSSRSMMLDPSIVPSLTDGETAFNAGVSGGTIRDMYVYARYADQLWGGDRGEFPHLVIGVVNDVLRYEGTASLDPRLKQFLPRAEKDLDQLGVAEALLQAKTVEAGVRAVNRVLRNEGPSALLDPVKPAGKVTADLAVEGRQRGNQRASLSDRGMQLFPPDNDMSLPLDERVEVHMREFARNSYDSDPDFEGADARAVELLRQTIELANRNGDVPTLWVTPLQPGARAFLPAAYDDRNERFRDVIATLQRDATLQFDFVDFDDLASFGGDPDEFYDGIHPTEKNTERMLAELARRGALDRAGNRTDVGG